MDFDWDKLWVIVCLGIVTIASASVGAAFFSASLADLSTPAVGIASLVWLWCRLIGVLFVVAIYLTLIGRAEVAMFATEIELARIGLNRRQATKYVYNGLFFVIFGLFVILALSIGENFANSLDTASMSPASD